MLKISSQLLMLMPLAMGIGVAMATQTALNAQLRTYLHSPLQAALLSFLVGSVVLAVLVYAQSTPKPSWSTLQQIPWYLWLGGCLGVYAISASIFTAPRLGFLTLTGLIIFGQILMSLILDHFAYFGVEKSPVSWSRLMGALVIFIGVLLSLHR